MTATIRRFEAPRGPVPLLPLRNGALFPGTAVTLPIGRKRSVALIEAASKGDIIGLAVQRDAEARDPGLEDLHPVGTYARLHNITAVGTGRFQIVVEGLGRLRLQRLVSSDPYWTAEVEPAEETVEDGRESQALAELLVEKLRALEPSLSDDLRRRVMAQSAAENPGLVADVVAAALSLPAEREVGVLLELDVGARLRRVHELLREAESLAEIKGKLAEEVQGELSKGQREVLLRQQLKAIQKELGEDGGDEQGDRLRQRLEELELPDEARKVVDRELRRLGQINPAQAEYHVIQNYLELVADLPWNERVPTNEDIDAVKDKLDRDHYGLDEIKKRILEHLAVRKMTHSNRGAILCLVGPPGVGKTSLGQSIADATGRPFVRSSLGGVRDEAEIRGHRRTYVGALPGRILSAMRRASAKNPLILLDEVDKLGVGWMGSPEAALLEVLDPEQNSTFTDHYLELPFDLSEVMFIATANSLETVSGPLRDRLEIIEIDGYTVQEKEAIARQHLLPELLEHHGLGEDALLLEDAALRSVIVDYTRESGVRQLKRELTRICRAVTLELARRPEGKGPRPRVGPEDLHRYLGKERFFNEVAERTAIPGVCTGLAWTPAGGDILFVESSRMPGKGRVETTGQLGEVMRESARAALTYIRSHADQLGLDPDFLELQDLHIHVPAGAVPKDGPSAGVTIFTALASLLTGRRVRSDTAMTGECTLRGRVLPVGGIKAKVLAAHRAGVRRVILPDKNRRDLEEVPVQVRDDLNVVFAEDMSQVLDAALEPPASVLERGLAASAASAQMELPGAAG